MESLSDTLRRLYAARRLHWGKTGEPEMFSVVASEEDLKALVEAAEAIEAARQEGGAS